MAERDRLPVLIGANRYLIDLHGYHREPVASMRQAVDQGVEAGEQSLNTDGIWKRTGSDFSFGAGQQFFDRPDSNRGRFRHADGIEWGLPGLRLLHGVGSPRSSANTNLGLEVVRDKMWLVDGQAVSVVTDPMAVVWSVAPASGLPANSIVAHVTDGRYIYLAYGTSAAVRTYRVDTTTATGALFSAAGVYADSIGYANGRLIASTNNELYELSGAGAKTSIFTHFSADFVWTAFCGQEKGIYCGGNTSTGLNGTVGQVWLVTVDSTGALKVSGIVASLPEGETVKALACYGGLVLIGTSKGVRVASVGSSGELTYGPLIALASPDRLNKLDAAITSGDVTLTLSDPSPQASPIPGSFIFVDDEALKVTAMPSTTSCTVSRGQLGTAAAAHSAGARITVTIPDSSVSTSSSFVTGFAMQAGQAWFTWSRPSSQRCGLGRLDLTKFTTPLVPAYAQDVMVVGPAPVGQWVTAAFGQVDSPVTWVTWSSNGRAYRFFVVQGQGVFYTTNGYPSQSADYRSGAVTFGTAERKAFQSLEVWCDPLPAATSVTFSVTDSQGTEHSAGSITTTGARSGKAVIADSVTDEWVEVRLLLARGTSNQTPVVQRWTLRAVPLPFRAERIVLPVILTSDVDDEGAAIQLDPWTEFSYLWGLYQSRSRVTYTLGSETLTVVVDGIEMAGSPTPAYSQTASLRQWNRDRTWVEGVWLVTLLTVDSGT